ncbi:MAG: HAMP domain-containing sensor histidine kinase [Gemmatimonadota bacterium]
MSLSLRQRILWWSLASTLLILLSAFFFVDGTFQSTILRGQEESLVAGSRLMSELQDAEIAEGLDQTARLATTPTLRAAIETRDSATIRQNLDRLLAESGLHWLAVTAPDGGLLAWTDGASTDRIAEADLLIEEARFYDTGDLWYRNGRLEQAHASGIFIGSAQVAVLVGGVPIGPARVERLQSATQQRVAFLSEGRIVAGGDALDDAARAELMQAWTSDAARAGVGDAAEALPGGEPIREFTLAGERFLGVTLPLPNAEGDAAGRLVAFRSLEDAMQPARDLRLALLAIAVVGILLAFTSSYVLSRRVTHPVNRLLDETVRLGSGDLDHPIVPERQDEIGKLAAGFEQMRKSLRDTREELVRAERLSAVGRAASAIVHDFRQPVMAIQGYVTLLKDDWDDEAQRAEDVAVIEQELTRMNAMMSEILDFARGGDALRPTEGSVEDLLEESGRAVRQTFVERGLTLQIEHGYTGEALLDFPRTRRVLENLLRNAAAAVPAGGTVTLRSAGRGSEIRLEVEDTGPGIPSEVRDTLFEPFVTHGKQEGTGLGLAIVKAFTERQGGSVSVDTSAAGTRFMLDLPVGGKA